MWSVLWENPHAGRMEGCRKLASGIGKCKVPVKLDVCRSLPIGQPDGGAVSFQSKPCWWDEVSLTCGSISDLVLWQRGIQLDATGILCPTSESGRSWPNSDLAPSSSITPVRFLLGEMQIKWKTGKRNKCGNGHGVLGKTNKQTGIQWKAIIYEFSYKLGFTIIIQDAGPIDFKRNGSIREI